MALIECPQCRHKISDKAHRCPKCGFIQKPSDRSYSLTETTSYGNNNIMPTEQVSPRRNYYWLWFVVGGLILIVLVLWLFKSNNTFSKQVGIITEETPIEATTEVERVITEERVMTEEEILNADTTHIIKGEEAVATDFDGVSSQQGTYTLTGKVNDKFAVQIWLTIDGNKLNGKYCYVSTLEKYGDQPSSYIQIQGYITSSNEFKFTTTYVNSSKQSEWEGDFKGNCFYAKNWGKNEVMIAYVDD